MKQRGACHLPVSFLKTHALIHLISAHRQQEYVNTALDNTLDFAVHRKRRKLSCRDHVHQTLIMLTSTTAAIIWIGL